MGCKSCSSTDNNGVPKGCKSNGSCATGTCGSKLHVFDWLANMSLPSGKEKFQIYEVRFKNGRKHFFRNIENLSLFNGDTVAVESHTSGHDIGTISLSGELVKTQMKKRNIKQDSEDVLKIFRKATQKDITIWDAVRAKEYETKHKGREIINKLSLKMKLSDVEYQGDGKKATFYYTADDRVDFRQLIRELASTFSIRVEMKQVGVRQEAARLGGIGSCGRELCCSTWINDFRKVNTSAARYQQLSLNPLKLSGQCGKLKCCLNYELDSYLDALKEFPKKNVVLKTDKGDAVFIKMDIFKKLVWYTYKDQRSKWVVLKLDVVKEIIELNAKGKLVSSLEDYESDSSLDDTGDFENAVGQDSLTRFDKPKKSKRIKHKPKINQEPNRKRVEKKSEKSTNNPTKYNTGRNNVVKSKNSNNRKSKKARIKNELNINAKAVIEPEKVNLIKPSLSKNPRKVKLNNTSKENKKLKKNDCRS